MDISAVRQALADAVDTISGLNCLAFVPKLVPDPCFYVGEMTIDPDFSFKQDDNVTITCRVLVSSADDRAGQKLLDGYLKRTGPTSIRAALEAARGAPGQAALSGLCDDLHVDRIAGYRLYQVGDKPYYGAEFTIRLIGGTT